LEERKSSHRGGSSEMLTMGQKKAITREVKERYQKARKKEKIMILDEFTRLTGYNRCYASQILAKSNILVLFR